MRFRSRCRCKKCGRHWTTKKRRSKKAPAHCPRCFSTRTRVMCYWKVK